MSSNFCSQCGNTVNPGDMFCRNCGAQLTGPVPQKDLQQEYQQPQKTYSGQEVSDNEASDKSWLVALLLCLFLGGLGFHRFYLGYTKRGTTHIILLILGIVLLFVFVGFVFFIIIAVMTLVDLLHILLKKLPDADGRPLQ